MLDSDAGFTVGDANDLAIYIDTASPGNEGVIENTVGQKLDLKLSPWRSNNRIVLSNGYYPTQTTTYDIGDKL